MSYVEVTADWINDRIPEMKLGVKKWHRCQVETQAKNYLKPVRFFGFTMREAMSQDAAIKHVIREIENSRDYHTEEYWMRSRYEGRMEEIDRLEKLASPNPYAKVLLSKKDMEFITCYLEWAETKYDAS